ncbi:MAG: hypothetical protein EBU90_20455 [Proteobacteria bacterium]|nr:hypothetical protein [Pseudomonadota bacterium]
MNRRDIQLINEAVHHLKPHVYIVRLFVNSSVVYAYTGNGEYGKVITLKDTIFTKTSKLGSFSDVTPQYIDHLLKEPNTFSMSLADWLKNIIKVVTSLRTYKRLPQHHKQDVIDFFTKAITDLSTIELSNIYRWEDPNAYLRKCTDIYLIAIHDPKQLKQKAQKDLEQHIDDNDILGIKDIFNEL